MKGIKPLKLTKKIKFINCHRNINLHFFFYWNLNTSFICNYQIICFCILNFCDFKVKRTLNSLSFCNSTCFIRNNLLRITNNIAHCIFNMNIISTSNIIIFYRFFLIETQIKNHIADLTV